jgi:uncharacterized protein YecE (DUF72 family)
MLYIGTSGYSYNDWVGRFYPAGLPSNRWLEFYLRNFSAVEINATYYRDFSPKQFLFFSRVLKDHQRIIFKLHQRFTHQRLWQSVEAQALRNSILPLRERGVLAGFLAQFPNAFHFSKTNLAYLERLYDEVATGTPLYFEFRHNSWENTAMPEWLAARQAVWVHVDEPDLPGLMSGQSASPIPFQYLRLHGRNSEQWYQPQAPAWERYNYLYNEKQLQEWLPCIQGSFYKDKNVFVFFNNHYQSQAVINAQMLIALAQNAGLGDYLVHAH